MCFSSSASFGAAAVLGVIGTASLAKSDRSQRLFAAVPLIFAAQQAMEGFVWITPAQSVAHQSSGLAFALIAYVVWPAYIPVAVWMMENTPKDRKRILPFMVLGGAIALLFLIILLVEPLVVVNGERHIRYLFSVPFEALVGICYVIATCGSLIASTHRWVRIVGLVTALSLGFALVLARTAVGSVWCFFAAILSSIILVHVLDTRKGHRK